MKTSLPRIGKVTLKGGAELRIIEGGSPEVGKNLVKNAKSAKELEPNMAGYVMVAWDFQGRYLRSFGIHDRSPIQQTRMPGYVKDVLLKEVTEGAVYHTLAEGEI